MHIHLSLPVSIGLLVAFALIMWGVTLWHGRSQKTTPETFFVAGRSVPVSVAAVAIAASWIWAPALFVGAQKAYQQGLIGVFWFIVPNVACLVLFATFAARLRKRIPDGYTLPQYMGRRYDRKVHGIYVFQLLALSACAFAEQLVGGGVVLSALTGIPFLTLTLALAGIVLVYSLLRGMRASVATNYLHVAFIAIIGIPIVVWAIAQGGGVGTIAAGLGGVSGKFTNPFSAVGWTAFLTFGLTTTLGLLAGPFGDQSFWQQGFAVRSGSVAQAFRRASIVFGVVVTSLALLGFLAAGLVRTHTLPGFAVASPTLTNLSVLVALLPRWTIIPFALMLVSGLTSAMDTALSAAGALFAVDVAPALLRSDKPISPETQVWLARLAMVALVVVGVFIANAPFVSVLWLFLFYSTLRSSTFLPTAISLLSDRPTGAGVFWGVLASLVLGLPVYAYGNTVGATPLIVLGALVTVGASGALTLLSMIAPSSRKVVAGDPVAATAAGDPATGPGFRP